MTKLEFVLFLFAFLSLAHCFSIIDDFSPLSDKVNNITDTQWQTISKIISWAEGNYSSTQLSSIAQLIYTQLRKDRAFYSWSVYVFDKDTKQLGYDGWASSDKFFWKFNYGKYNLTYMSYADVTCYGPAATGGTAQFGQSISAQNQQKIKDLVHNSVIYRGDNIQGAAQYIKSKLKDGVKGSWTVVVTSPTTIFGYYACMYKENWAILRSYDEFKWNYIMSKNYPS